MTRDEFIEIFYISSNRFQCQMGRKASMMRLGPDAEAALLDVVLFMKINEANQDNLLSANSIMGPLGFLYGYPLFPMKANGVAAV